MPGSAIVYAAGRGQRLGPAYAGRQKLMLRFGGRSLLAWHARRLAAAGVGEMVVVTGFGREQVAAAMPAVARDTGLRLREVFNPDFDAGSVLSLAASLPVVESAGEPLLLLDGDVLYPAGFIERLLASRYRSVLLVDRAWSDADDDPVLVPLVADLSREFDPFQFANNKHNVVPRLQGEARGQSYDEVIRALVLAGCFGAEDVSGEPWTELDFPGDVARAELEVMPAILAAGG